MQLYQAALLDFVVVIACAISMWKYARVSALHPGPVYLLFHLLVFTSRTCSILAGSPTLFTGWHHGGIPVTEEEIAWACNLADAALVFMTIASVRASIDDHSKYGSQPANEALDFAAAVLSERVLWIVGGVAAPIGLVALVLFGNTGNAMVHKIDLGDWNSSSWTVMTQSWTGLVLLALIYYYGFRKIFVVPMAGYLLLMAIQGFDRFRVVIPLLYLLLVYLSRKGRKWPPVWMWITALAMILVFIPLKTIGRMVQKGEPVSDIAEVANTMISDATNGNSDDQMVMDEFASTISLVDDSHHYYYGTLYYPLLTLPIPKQWWPDKPALNQYQHEISNPSRPMSRAGMVATLHGESYANMGVLGIIITSYLCAYCLSRFYFTAMRKHYYSVYRFTYLMIACNLVQVFRDGLISLVVFTLVNMSPLVLIALFSWLTSRRQQRDVGMNWRSSSPETVGGIQVGHA
jgi:hypothetical protein